MKIEIVDSTPFISDVNNFISNILRTDDNDFDCEVKSYFGQNRYERKEIEFRSIYTDVTSIKFSDKSPFYIVKLDGVVKVEGIYKVERDGGWIGKGFANFVGFSIEVDSETHNYKM